MENASGLRVVEVFKTNVTDDQAAPALDHLKALMPAAKINFDLEDCDRILRVEAAAVCIQKVIDLMTSLRIECAVLEG